MERKPFFVFLRPEGQNFVGGVERNKSVTKKLEIRPYFIKEKNPINRLPSFICTRTIAARTFLGTQVLNEEIRFECANLTESK